MAYGLRFYGDNQQLIFDTDNFPTARTLVVGSSGTLTSGSTLTLNSSNYPSGALLFGRIQDGSGQLLGRYNQGNFINESSETIDYFIAIPSNNASNISGQTYGLEIYTNDSPQKVAFSTRRVGNSSINFLRVHDHDSLSTGGSVYGSTSGVYVSMDYMHYFYSVNQLEVVVNGFQFGSSGISFIGYLETYEVGAPDQSDLYNKGTISVVQLRTS